MLHVLVLDSLVRPERNARQLGLISMQHHVVHRTVQFLQDENSHAECLSRVMLF